MRFLSLMFYILGVRFADPAELYNLNIYLKHSHLVNLLIILSYQEIYV